MAEKSLKLGQRVEVTGKDVKGCVAYVGTTMFAAGKWIGVILDEPKGKNNGTVQGKTYFQCPENYGMFVRQSQLTLLDEAGTPVSDLPSPAPSGTSSTSAQGDRDARRSTLSGTSIRRRTQPTTVRRKASPPSTSRTRMDKSSSRLSLVSSRSQGEFPTKDESGREATTPSASEPTSKRASFIETGFVETLKPQYIPGPAMVSPGASMTTSMGGGGGAGGSVEERLTQLQMQQEMEGLRAEVRDLNEKLETLRAKRQQDKEKLKEHDKLRMQLEQMVEFKTRIMESQAALQRDLQRAKQEAREAIDARERHADEMADLAETVEMATLDKEMAEEKAETLQLELEQVRERLEEVTLDLEILKAELSERAGGPPSADGSAPSSFELKQLQQQNARLRETLVRMRDLSAHEKHEAGKLQKELDQRKSEVLELQRTKEKLSARVEEQEHQIADLQEQVDAALGAEEMVQQLVDSKLELEERLKELQETVAELEELQDMNEQLQEGSRELEVELREELDLAKAATRQAQRELEAMHETLADRDATIMKFRELVQRQQDTLQETRAQLERESSRPVSALPTDVIDFQKMFAETKAHTKAIDLELRRLDVQQANEHVRYLAAYMPDSFMTRGGDHEAVLLLLLVPRIIWKTEILLAQLRDKFPTVEKVDKAAVTKDHAVEQFAYRCCVSFHLYCLQTVLQQFWHALSVCTPEALLKAGASWSDMSAQEKAVDALLELLKRDKLDEHVSTEALERCVNYFTAVCPVVLGTPSPPHHSQLVLVGTRSLQAACEAMTTQGAALRAIVQAGQELGEIGLLAQHVATQGDTLTQQLKQARRRLPQEGAPSQLGLANDVVSGLQEAFVHSGRVVRTLQEVLHAAMQQIGLGEDVESGVPHEKLREFSHVACDRVYDEDKGPVECIKSSIQLISREVTRLSQFLADNEYEINTMSTAEEKPTAPIVLRAQTVKKELEETKILRHKLEMKDTDIKELKLTVKLKQEELSEMTIRKDMAEKKLGSSHKDYELTIEKLKRKVDDTQQLLKRKEKEFEESMDHLQADIDSLESERGELKEKLKSMTKKALFEGMGKSAAISSAAQQQAQMTAGPGSIVSSTEAVRDSPLLLSKIHDLEAALELARDENWRLCTQQMSQKLAALKPLHVAGYKPPPKSQNEETEREESRQRQVRLAELIKKGDEMKKDLWSSMTPKVLDISKHSPGAWEDIKADWVRYETEKAVKEEAAKERARMYLLEAAQEIVKCKRGGSVSADFTTFPTPEMTKAFGKTEAKTIGRVHIPSQTGESGVVPVLLTPDTLYQVHSRLLSAF
ncbi:hypothetical protein R5R35_001346 [Gryllus longicercus]|uniref:Dynactin subunit 1 n=1 Tax=Gryllus longicercus TaxID=2509291 RepID=A0AAN9VJD7_9ORTH